MMVGVIRAAAGMVFVALMLTRPGPVPAHPHVFVEYRVALLFGAEGLGGVRFFWTMDEMFSAMIHQRLR
jgi:ABC-type uncharacterized transport system substrate-binding protein